MKRRRFLKQLIAYVLAFCMLASGTIGTDLGTVHAAEERAGEGETTTVYFYNGDGWNKVSAYVYGASDNTVNSSGWPGTQVDDASNEIGPNWYKTTVETNSAFTIIFNDTQENNKETGSININDENVGYKADVYLIAKDSIAYLNYTKDDALKAQEALYNTEGTVLYFYNDQGWTDVYAHAYYNDGNGDVNVGLNWPGKAMTSVSEEVGKNWYKVIISRKEPFTVIFNNNSGDELKGCYITTNDVDNYIIELDGEVTRYDSLDAANKALGIETDPEGPEEKPDDGKTTTVYFYNGDGWDEVTAHIYGSSDAEVNTEWPGQSTEEVAEDDEMGPDWYKTTVETNSSFSIVFNNGNNGKQVQDTVIKANAGEAYLIAKNGIAYLNYTKEDVEKALEALGDDIDGTVLYFYNNQGWDKVCAYAYVGADPVILGWPGKVMKSVKDEVGENWYKVTIPSKDPFSVIFNNGIIGENGKQLGGCYITTNDVDNYMIEIDETVYRCSTLEVAKEAIESGNPPVEPEDDTDGTVLYFYNNRNWTDVYAYAYYRDDTTNKDVDVELGWPGKAMTSVSDEIGENWYKVTISRKEPFTVIFNNGTKVAEEDREELKGYNITTNSQPNYMIEIDGTVYRCSSQAVAEEAIKSGTPPVEPDDDTEKTTVYFYNCTGWKTVGAHAWGEKDLTGSWGSTTAKTSDIGPDWVEVTVSSAPPFSIIFFDKEGDADNNRSTVDIKNREDVYVILGDQSYSSKEDAEDAAKNTPTTIYFFSRTSESDGWKDVNVNAVTEDKSVIYDDKAESAEKEIDADWWKVTIKKNAYMEPFYVTFSNSDNTKKTPSIKITRSDNNYVTVKGDKVYTSVAEAGASVGVKYTTTVYFLNSKDWAEVGAYVYGAAGPALGGWPGKIAEAAEELGGKWFKIEVPALPPFNIIFFNTADDQERTELLIPDEKHLYVTGSKELYGSAEEAELAEGLGDPSKMTTIYFYDNQDWESVYGYSFTKEDPYDEEEAETVLGKEWPGRETESAENDKNAGKNWRKVIIPRVASEENPFFIVFNDKVNRTEDVLITDRENVYVIMPGLAFASAKEAEEAAANIVIVDGCEEGPNKDLDNYNVSYPGPGAALPYITYEAEKAATNGDVLPESKTFSDDIQSEASGRQAVKLTNAGEYVEFTLKEPANSLVLRYSIPDSSDGSGIDAALSMDINGVKSNLTLTSKYAWVYGDYPYFNNPNSGTPHRFFDEVRTKFDQTYPAGTKIKLQKNAGDVEYIIIDFIECENVGEALTQPENSLSVTDYGAVAGDGEDDYDAFEKCIKAAKAQKKEVWIPEGTFDLKARKALKVDAVTIRGAGMWYTKLEGAGAAFKFKGTCKFYDFAMTGDATVRRDSEDLAGFEDNGRSTNVTIQNVWMEHIKVGIWCANTTNLIIQGCRIRNTYADGINLCSRNYNATVRNNNVRNTGDDGIAIWPWMSNSTDNTITHNTVQSPDLANGIAIYGGGNNRVIANHVLDIRHNGSGICLGSTFDTEKGYTGKTTVEGNLLVRCGSWQRDANYPIGALWIWSTWHPMTGGYELSDNTLIDCFEEGILVDRGSDVRGLYIHNIEVNGAEDAIWIRHYQDVAGSGEAFIDESTISGDYTGETIKNDDPNFIVNGVKGEDGEAGKGFLVAFDSQGGSAVSAVLVDNGQPVTKPADPERAGYTFLGWYLNDEVYDFSKPVTENITLEARWEAIITDPGTDPEPGTDPDDNGVLEGDLPEGEEAPKELWIAGVGAQTYTGKAIKPDVRVYDGSTRLKAGTDYTISYKNNTKANDASDPKKAPTITVKGKGNYSGSATATFKINPVDLNDTSVISVAGIVVAYNKKVQKKVPTVTFNGKKLANKSDFTVSYPDEGKDMGDLVAYKDEGTYQIRLKGIGNFKGELDVNLEITNKTFIDKAKVKKIPNKTYEGKPVTLSNDELVVYMKKVSEPLILGTDYDVRYENNNGVGTAAVIITGKGDYTGTKRATFKITGAPLNKATVKGFESSKVYDGSAQYQSKVEVKLNGETLAKYKDYKVIYDKDPVNVGTVRMTIQGIGKYTGTIKKTFRITAYDLTAEDSRLTGLPANPEDLEVKYAKGGCKPEVSLMFGNKKLVSGTDYKISYSKNTNITDVNTSPNNMPTITIQGKGNFKGKLTANFKIVSKGLNDSEAPVTMTVADIAYANKNGNYISKPVLTDVDGKALKAGTDYTVTYALADGTKLDNRYKVEDAGTEIHVTATGKGKYLETDPITETYKVTLSSFSKAKITIKSMTYTGDPIELGRDDITVKIGGETLVLGTDYEIVEDSYVNNTNKGTASVQLKGMGNYGGTKTVKFKIQAQKMVSFANFVETLKSSLGL